MVSCHPQACFGGGVVRRVGGSWTALIVSRPGDSPSPCGCGAWSPAAPWPSGSDCAPCHRPGSQSRCQHHRWAGESEAWLQIQKQMVSGRGCKLADRQTDTETDRQANWTQVGRQTTGQRKRELKEECRYKSDTEILTEALLSLAFFHSQ